MKKTLLLCALFVGLFACKKNANEVADACSSISKDAINQKNGGGNGNGGTTPGGLITGIGGAFKLIGGNNDSIQVNFSQAAPVAGWNLNLSSSDPAVVLPANYFVPQGTFNAHPPLTSSVITTSHNVTLTASLAGQSKSYILKVYPLHVNFPAPILQSPGNGAGFKNRLQVTFQWSDNGNAYYHDIQVSDNPSFTNLILEVYTDNPMWAASYFNGLGTRYWRVRYIDGSGTPGPWSAARNFQIKQ